MAVSRNMVRDMFTSDGTVTLNGVTGVVVNSTVAIGPGTQILLTPKTPAGTQTGAAYISAITLGQVGTAAFTVKGTGSLDTSVYNYTVIG